MDHWGQFVAEGKTVDGSIQGRLHVEFCVLVEGLVATVFAVGCRMVLVWAVVAGALTC